jgi:hypothetical protein
MSHEPNHLTGRPVGGTPVLPVAKRRLPWPSTRATRSAEVELDATPVSDLGVEPRLPGDVRDQLRLEFQVSQSVLARLEYLHVEGTSYRRREVRGCVSRSAVERGNRALPACSGSAQRRNTARNATLRGQGIEDCSG